MAPTDHTYPQDPGTGTSEGDFNDAAAFAQATFDPALKDTVVKGLTMSNLGAGDFDLGGGVAKVYVPSMQTKDHGNGQEVRDECLITQQVAKRTGIAYVGTGTTHVFIQLDLTVDDKVTVVTNGDGAAPTEPYMKLGTIDESTNSATHVNRDAYDYPTFKTSVPTGEHAEIPAGEGLVATTMDVKGELEINGEFAAVGEK